MTEKQAIEFNKKNVYIGSSKRLYGKTHLAKRDFKKGEVVMMGFGKVIDHQTSLVSIQVDINKHYLPKIWTGRYWNHSCDPNTYIKTREDGFPNLIALKLIKKGEEITYSYWMSEFRWTRNANENKIKCRCGSENCKGKILSFFQLSKKIQKDIINKKNCAKYLINSKLVAGVVK